MANYNMTAVGALDLEADANDVNLETSGAAYLDLLSGVTTLAQPSFTLVTPYLGLAKASVTDRILDDVPRELGSNFDIIDTAIELLNDDVNENLTRLVYNSLVNNYPTRPPLPAGMVEYDGPTAPSDPLAGDTWVNTATFSYSIFSSGAWQNTASGSGSTTTVSAADDTITVGGSGTAYSVKVTPGTFDPAGIAAYSTADVILYVSTSGNDANNGRAPGEAKATIAGALAVLGSNPGHIKVAPGTYTITATDANGNGVTLANTGTILEGAGNQLTWINVNTNATWGLKTLGHCIVKDLTVVVPSGKTVTYGCGVSCASTGTAESSVFERVNVQSSGTVTALFAVGPDNPGSSGMDISMTRFDGCEAEMLTGSATHGYLFGNGTAGNELMALCVNCSGYGMQYGVTIQGCGINWISGGFTGCTTADINYDGSGGDTSTFYRMRNENGVQAIRTVPSGPSTPLLLDSCFFGYYTGPGGNGQLIEWAPNGTLILRGCNFDTSANATANTNFNLNTAVGNYNALIAEGITCDVPNPFPAADTSLRMRTITNYSYFPDFGNPIYPPDLQNVHDSPPVARYFVDPTNGNDANDGLSPAAAFATITNAIGSNRIVTLLPGFHQLSAAVAITNQNYLTIEGAGPQVSTVVVNGNYDAFTVSGSWSQIHLKNFDVASFANRSAGYAVNAQGTSGTHADHLYLENITATDTYGGFYFKYVDVSRYENLEYIQASSGASGTDMCTFFSCISSRLHNLSETVTAGTIGGNCLLVDSDCDTFEATGIEVGDCADNGILLQNSLGTGHTGPRLVRITDFWVESCTLAGVAVTSGHDIKLTNGESALNLTDGYVVKGNGNGTGDEGIIGFTAVNCYAALNNQHGFHVASNNGTPMAFVGCTSICNSQQTNVTYNQFQIDNSVTHVVLQGGTAGDYYYTLTNHAAYGVSIGATSTDYITVNAMDLAGTTGPMHNQSTGTHNQIYGNKGVTTGETLTISGALGLALAGATTTTTSPSAGAGGALPATPAGYISVPINGTTRKIPYY